MQEHSDYYSDLLPNKDLIAGVSKRSFGLIDLVESLGLENRPLVQLDQVHSATCAEVVTPETQTLAQTDAAFTTLRHVALAVRTADCLPILIAHPQLVGVVHAGRRGTDSEILLKLLWLIRERHGISGGFSFWMGPCICRACYQVDAVQDIHYDLMAQNMAQLESFGCLSSCQVVTSDFCTKCRQDMFYSYRGGAREYERTWGIITLTDHNR